MHIQIMNLEALETDRQNFRTSVNEEDKVIMEEVDYVGDMYNEEDRRDAIESEWFERFFDGIAEVNMEKETVRFYERDVIEGTIRDYLRELTSEMAEAAEIGDLLVWDVISAGKYYKGDLTLLCMEGVVYTSLGFIHEAPYLAGKTMRIGNIFDAHC